MAPHDKAQGRQVDAARARRTMTFSCKYGTPAGFSDMVMISDGKVLTGLHFAESMRSDCGECDLPIFRETRRWLDCYFSGRQPDFTPPYRIDGLTPFRKDVMDEMLAIPFGQTTTYGSIAANIAQKRGLAKMSAQAVGGAVGWNPICIIIPCHRVIGANNALVGYGGGINNKIALLAHERRSLPMLAQLSRTYTAKAPFRRACPNPSDERAME